jgi:hypothetical protein
VTDTRDPIKSGDEIQLGPNRVMKAKDFFALPLAKQIALKNQIAKLLYPKRKHRARR